MAALVTAREIPPGEEGKIEVRLNLGKVLGPFSKTITVKSSDPATPVVILTVRGEMQTYIDIQPDIVGFKDIDRTRLATQRLAFIGLDLPRVIIKKISIKGSGDRSLFQWKILDNRRVSPADLFLEVTFDPRGQKMQKVQEELIIELENTHASQLVIPLVAYIPGPLIIDPPNMSIECTDAQQTIKKVFKISHQDGIPFRIEAAKSSLPDLKIEIPRTAENVSFDIELTAVCPKGPDPVSTEVSIQLEVIVPVSLFPKQ